MTGGVSVERGRCRASGCRGRGQSGLSFVSVRVWPFFPVVIVSRSICFLPGVPVSAGGLFRQCFPVQNVPEGGRVFSGGRMG